MSKTAATADKSSRKSHKWTTAQADLTDQAVRARRASLLETIYVEVQA